MSISPQRHSQWREVLAGAGIGAILLGGIAGMGMAWRPVTPGEAMAAGGAFAFPSPSPVAPALSVAGNETSKDVNGKPPLVPDLHSATMRAPPAASAGDRVIHPNTPAQGRSGHDFSWQEPGTQWAPPAADLNSPAFRRLVETAKKSRDPAAAVIAIENFRTANPDPLYTPHLDELVEAAMDRLYWQRIRQLIEERQQINRQMNELRVEQSRSSDAARRRQIVELTEQLRTRMMQVADDLRTMGYTLATIPDLENDQQIAELRAQRDAATHETWVNRVHNTIVYTRGTPPWDLP